MKRSSTVWRVLVSAGLLAVLAHSLDLRPLRDVLPRFQPAYYLLALAMMAAYVGLQAWILTLLLRRQAQEVRVGAIARLQVISAFFGVFLPGGIGSDVILCYQLCRPSAAKENPLSAVVFSRVAGLVAMVLIAFVASFSPRCPIPGLSLVLGLLLAAGLAAFGLLSRDASVRGAGRLLGFLRRHRATAVLYRTVAALARVGRDRRIWIQIGPLFVLVGLFRVFMDYVVARAIGIQLPALYFLVFAPLVTLATVVPLTIAGLGIREGTYVGLFALVGLPGAEAFTMSLLSFSLSLWVCAVGAALYAWQGGAKGMPQPEPVRP